jgi:hypothetical protein
METGCRTGGEDSVTAKMSAATAPPRASTGRGANHPLHRLRGSVRREAPQALAHGGRKRFDLIESLLALRTDQQMRLQQLQLGFGQTAQGVEFQGVFGGVRHQWLSSITGLENVAFRRGTFL